MSRLTKEDYIDWEYRTGYYNKKYVKCLNEKTLKLGKLEDIEEELGCPLEVVFKAIDKGIKTTEHYDIGSGQTFKEYIKVEEPHLTFTSIEQDWLKDMDFFKDYANKWCFYFKDFVYLEDKENDEYECLVKLSDYQKTWWLKGEKENGQQ